MNGSPEGLPRTLWVEPLVEWCHVEASKPASEILLEPELIDRLHRPLVCVYTELRIAGEPVAEERRRGTRDDGGYVPGFGCDRGECIEPGGSVLAPPSTGSTDGIDPVEKDKLSSARRRHVCLEVIDGCAERLRRVDLKEW